MFPLAIVLSVGAFREDARVWLYAGPLAVVGLLIAAYALSLYNRRIPDDISLVASERTMYSRYAIPPQTTITQDYAAQAAAVADALDSRLRGNPFPQRTVIPYRLIERDSVGGRHSVP